MKTILTVLGTVYGAYFGARVAGRYAISSVQKQIINQMELEKLKEKKQLDRYELFYKSKLIAVNMYLGIFLEHLNIVESFEIKTNIELFIDLKTSFTNVVNMDLDRGLLVIILKTENSLSALIAALKTFEIVFREAPKEEHEKIRREMTIQIEGYLKQLFEILKEIDKR